MLLGLLRPVSGDIRLLGERLPEALPGALRRVGSLIEQPSLYEHLTGRENLEIVRRLKGAGRADAERAVEALGMGDYAGNPVAEYSRGMRQRLGIAIAVLGRPDLVLLDEPMNGLDAGGLETFRNLIRDTNREHGTTFLVSSHQLDVLDLISTHVGILDHEGDLLFQGTRQELSARVPQELRIEVDRRAEAIRILSAAGYAVDARRERLVIRGVARDTTREVNRLLVEGGVGVERLALELATLEQLFLEVTGGAREEAVQR
jgi:ABC-2 type transport system ATP-binding protein